MNSIDRFMRSQLKLRHLQLLIAIDDLRNIGKVANYLNVSQPAVSKALSELENNIRLKLFYRTGHGMEPTIYGKSLIVYAKKILTELGKARDELSALISGLEGKVSVGVLPGAAVVVVPEAMVQLKQQSVNTGITLVEGAMETLKPKLLSGEIEIIVGMLPDDSQLSYMEKIILYQDEMVLTAGSHHPLAKVKEINWKKLQNTSWILPPHGSITREPIEQIFCRHQITMPVNYIESISTMVNIGIMQHSLTLAFLPDVVARYYASIGLLAILPLKAVELVQPVGVLHMKQQTLSPSVQLFINILIGIYNNKDDCPG